MLGITATKFSFEHDDSESVFPRNLMSHVYPLLVAFLKFAICGGGRETAC
jgi:hypothetical protein